MGTRIKYDQETIDYLNYLFDNPEVISHQPKCAAAGSPWLQKFFDGQCSGLDAEREMKTILSRWETYHSKKAKSLGWEIDLQEFRRLFTLRRGKTSKPAEPAGI